MIILVANLGSTSFKSKLFDMDSSRVLATAAADRIGNAPSGWQVTVADRDASGEAALADHGQAIDLLLKQVGQMGCDVVGRLDAIGFKAVHGGPISGAVIVDDQVLATMQRFADVAPAHNPPYIAAMRALREQLPGVPQVAAFETAFHQTIPAARQTFGIPYQWTEQLGVRRYGFHGASHQYIATRMAEVAPGARKLISCHLGGSSSVCAIRDGRSAANSFGMTPQSGLPQSGRVGDFDLYALLKLNAAGHSTQAVLDTLGHDGGLKGISGVGSDLRDIERAADEGNERAKLAIDVFVESLRHYIGAYLAVLNGADAIVFTGGIGQHSARVRAAALAEMDYAGIAPDASNNDAARGDSEARIDAADRRVQLWVMPTNEELIVARQAAAALSKQHVQR